jgi:hypothetical protein
LPRVFSKGWYSPSRESVNIETTAVFGKTTGSVVLQTEPAPETRLCYVSFEAAGVFSDTPSYLFSME